MGVIVDVSLFSMDKGERLSPYATRSIRIIADSGLPFEHHSMGTSVFLRTEPRLMAWSPVLSRPTGR